MTDVSDTLRQALALIEKPENWCKGQLSRDRHGHPSHPCEPDSVKWSAPGAIVYVAWGDRYAQFLAERALDRSLYFTTQGLWGFNDDPDTTHPMVVDLFKRAIAERKRMADWQPIETAPRDGTLLRLCWMDDGPTDVCEPMRWNPTGANAWASLPGTEGIWEHESGGMTWDVSRGHGPTHWQPLPDPPK